VTHNSHRIHVLLRSEENNLYGRGVHSIHTHVEFNQSSINLFVQKCNKHWTGHQGRMQPPLTGASSFCIGTVSYYKTVTIATSVAEQPQKNA